ncbi:hypothetical protein GCM10022237_39160 [Nocardioides ginsengisoli]|uniref:Helix-turn-helix domain-containing protein n=1 Tax=Nocardioides ginsengisoli TaxID=363868 RepID=A0ABW3VZS3_9ACTN
MNAVRRIRTEAGLTQGQLAARSGVAQPNIAAYESGARRPSKAMLDRLAKAAAPLPHELLADRRLDLLRIAARYRVEGVRVFGSAARGTDTPDSDVDLLVKVPANAGMMTVAAFALEIEDLLGVPVDVVSEAALAREHRIRREAVAL